jgi:hypothetical protein
MRERSFRCGDTLVTASYRSGSALSEALEELEASCCYRVETRPMTEANGTSSPSWYHHFASHMWHVVKETSRSLTDIPMLMSSPVRHSGQKVLSAIGAMRS